MSWEYPITSMRFIKRQGDAGDELRIRVEFADHFERPALKGLRQDDNTININALGQPVFAYFDNVKKFAELLPLLQNYDEGSELPDLDQQKLLEIREYCQDLTWLILEDYDAEKKNIKVE